VPTGVSERLRAQVSRADHHCCAYCQTSEANSGIPLTIDHILPISKGGKTSFENLCLACFTCNEFKGTLIEADDPLTGDTVLLFNPRTQVWLEHFRWSADSTRIEGVIAIGRATVLALRMNREAILAARMRWVWGGWHPPVTG
jgi:hypothetical protein